MLFAVVVFAKISFRSFPCTDQIVFYFDLNIIDKPALYQATTGGIFLQRGVGEVFFLGGLNFEVVLILKFVFIFDVAFSFEVVYLGVETS